MIGYNRSMVLLDIAIYFIATLGFAVLWHLAWFSSAYTALNWPDPSEADVPLGALSILFRPSCWRSRSTGF